MPTPFLKNPIIPSNSASIRANLWIFGLCQGTTDPLFYEIAAEVTYPLPEGITGGLITIIVNAIDVIVYFITPVISIDWINII